MRNNQPDKKQPWIEAEETLLAIRKGAVDAFVVEEAQGQRVYALEAADLPYSFLVERMQQGAAMLNAGGDIIYCNQSLARLLGLQAEKLVGTPLCQLIDPGDQAFCQELLDRSKLGSVEGEMRLTCGDRAVPFANFAFMSLAQDGSAFGVLVTDLTTQKHQVELAAVHEALRISERHLHSVFSASAVGLAIHTLDGRFLRVNHAFCSITGYSSEELTGLSYPSLMHPEDWRQSQKMLRQLASGELPSFVAERRFIQKNGRRVWVQNSVSLLRSEAGEAPDTVIVVCEDINRRKEAEEALRESEDRFRTLADHIPPFAWMADRDGSIFWYNRRWFEYTGTTLEEVRGWGWTRVHHPDHIERVVAKISHCFASGEDWEDTFPLRGKDGNYRWFLSRAVPIRNPQGEIFRWLGTNTDITQQKEIESALQEVRKELESRVDQRTTELRAANEGLRELSSRLLQMQDQERRRIARELHDSIGQLLVAMALSLGTVQREEHKLSAEAARAVEDGTALVDEISKEIRTISHLLHPPLLDEVGLASALQWYIDGFAERSKIKTTVNIPETLDRLPEDQEIAIFRAVQECLTNVHRHSGSASCSVTITQDEKELRVEIRDTGRGIPKGKELSLAGSGGVGYRGMQERLRQLGGSLEIESSGSGTIVRATLPVAHRAKTASGEKDVG
jgi:PAS domain S-box-containing protein